MTVLKDYLIAQTPFRALILQGPFSLCAYLGVPQSHWLADMHELELRCHGGVTYQGEGTGYRPAGWYWYGWDYAHAGDMRELPPELRDSIDLTSLESAWPARAKKWTVAEVEQDVWDTAMALKEALERALDIASALRGQPLTPGGPGDT